MGFIRAQPSLIWRRSFTQLHVSRSHSEICYGKAANSDPPFFLNFISSRSLLFPMAISQRGQNFERPTV